MCGFIVPASSGIRAKTSVCSGTMDWPEKVEIFGDIYGLRGSQYGLDALNEAETTFFCIRPFLMETKNGGFWQFFYNDTGAFTHQTHKALTRIGATVSASLFLQAVAVYFGLNAIPDDADARHRLINDIDGDHTPAANHLSKRYFALHESVSKLLEAYTIANEPQLRLTLDEAATATVLEGNWRQCTKCSDAWEEIPTERLSWCPSCRTLTFVRTPVDAGGA